MRLHKERRIDDLDVEATPLPAMRGMTLFARFGRIAAPALATLAKGGGLAGGGALDAIAEIFQQAAPEELAGVIVELMSSVTVTVEENGKRRRVDLDSTAKIDEVFTGRFATQLKTVAFAAETNWGADFFVAALAKGRGLERPAKPKRSRSPKKSSTSGQPGDSGSKGEQP